MIKLLDYIITDEINIEEVSECDISFILAMEDSGKYYISPVIRNKPYFRYKRYYPDRDSAHENWRLFEEATNRRACLLYLGWYKGSEKYRRIMERWTQSST